ncbi:MAG: VCBS repeat-containing protein [Saprospiraceae bacterium]|nr:VCBS repeat-containing protein [Saprospiraceae bacterium]MCB9326342.1 VCBS repeat-containing protein [Lewinellaceae bacterium]
MQSFYTSIKTALFVLLAVQLSAQISFTNRNDLLTNSNFHSGVGIAVLDMNNDGLDDIARMDNGHTVEIQHQLPGGNGFSSLSVMTVNGGSQWSMCAGDVDNNGYNDILAGGYYDKIKILSANDDGTAYTNQFAPGANIFAQCSNMADINNDGFLDLFVCHDDGESRIWANNGDGTFSEADYWIDMTTTPASDNSGNYGSIWTDFDNDGDIDLYIAKCRGGVSDPTDPRRINALFVNDGNNNYTEAAETYGLKIGAQSWTADFNDIDNDGDLDCFVTNHDVSNMLLENDGTGHFTDISVTAGINGTGGFPIQGVMRDFDNDGFVDIMIAGGSHQLYRNNGDKTFSLVNGLFDNNDMESYGIGDLNNDGYLDIYGGYAQIYTNPSNIDDVLWINNGGDNHYLSVHLSGNQSNKSGVGSRVEIYGNWGIQVREVRSGESYGIQNSMNCHFGLGQNDMIDSLIVRWPSGIVDKFENVEANQLITVNENNCISPNAELTVDGSTTICPGDSTTLVAPEGFFYSWSTGDTTQTINVTDQGSYNVTIDDGSGCKGISAVINILVNPEITPTIAMEGDQTLCQGETITLTASEAESYLWSNGETTQSIEVSGEDSYHVTVPGLCQDFTSPDFYPGVTVLYPEVPEVENDTLYEIGSATLTAVGDSLNWFDALGNLVGTENTFETPELLETTSYFVTNTQTFESSFFTGMEAPNASTPYSGGQYNGETIFDALEPFVLRNVTVYTDTPGERIIELRNSNGDVLQSLSFIAVEGEQIVSLNFEVPAGEDMVLTTNTEKNLEIFGTNSPRFQRSNMGVAYPYIVDEVLSIKNSNLGIEYYYYFFNWEIKTIGKICSSDAVEVTVELILTATNEVNAQGSLTVSPNPSTGQFTIQLKEIPQQGDVIHIYNFAGALVQTTTVRDQSLSQKVSIRNPTSGFYLVEVVSGNKIYTGKVVIE